MTIEELKDSIKNIDERINHLHSFLKIEEKQEEMKLIEEKMSRDDFWNNKEDAQTTVNSLSLCRQIIEPFSKIKNELEELTIHCEFAEDDAEYLNEAEKAEKVLVKKLDDLELLSFLSGKFDKNGVYVSIHAGAGGTESCDWTGMLMRMYRRYFEKQGWKDEIIDIQMGDEAGVKSVTLLVHGNFAYGYMKCEKGIHRLVRISPFDSNARRHTSFASLDAFPEITDDIDIEIEEKDLRIDTFRASGAGGQHVNTTDSAIRITHIPTNIIVACQNERSQHKNRATAMNMLKAKLYEYEEEKRQREADLIRGEKTDNGWGNQIRSYVLHPYQMVKDLRTGCETSDTSGVLDGDINNFIESYLKGVRVED